MGNFGFHIGINKNLTERDDLDDDINLFVGFDKELNRSFSIFGEYNFARDDDDFRPDDITKKEIFEKVLTDGFRPQLAFDDRDQVVSMWRSIGLPCFQVRGGKF